MVGLGRFELPTSPLSGVRSNQLSYRPLTSGLGPPAMLWVGQPVGRLRTEAGGAGRDRTGDLLNANQALSQLSYSPRKKLIEADWMQGGQHQAIHHSNESSRTSGKEVRNVLGLLGSLLF